MRYFEYLEDFEGTSLTAFVEWAKVVLKECPDAEVRTYETDNIVVGFDTDLKRVTISGRLL